MAYQKEIPSVSKRQLHDIFLRLYDIILELEESQRHVDEQFHENVEKSQISVVMSEERLVKLSSRKQSIKKYVSIAIQNDQDRH